MGSKHPIRVLVAAVLVGAVAAGGADATVLNVPAEYGTIGEAIEASEWGDTILVGPGRYPESMLLSDVKGDGVILRSSDGPDVTTIVYGEVANANEAVITFQRCSNSTQLIGFTIDGRGASRRGILVNQESRPVLSNLVIHDTEYGIASHRSSNPFVEHVRIYGTQTAGLFVQGGSADVRDCSFSESEKFGIYVRGTLDPMRLRGITVTNNGQVGLQATEGEFSIIGGLFANNGDSGLILQDVSPELEDLIVENHPNVGMVLEACWGVITNCQIRNNEYGIVVSIEGTPEIYNCKFENNASYHMGIEGDSDPVVGGSLEQANEFLGEAAYIVTTSSAQRVVFTHNYWGQPCVPEEAFQNTGTGRLIRKPWAAPNLLREFDNCAEARKYHKKWENGKLDNDGNPIGNDARVAPTGDRTIYAALNNDAKTAGPRGR
jgi:parallel beta-helix repeat protein